MDCSSDFINGSNLISVYFSAQSVMNKLDDLHTMVCSFQPDISGIRVGPTALSWIPNWRFLGMRLFGGTDQTYTEEVV